MSITTVEHYGSDAHQVDLTGVGHFGRDQRPEFEHRPYLNTITDRSKSKLSSSGKKYLENFSHFLNQVVYKGPVDDVFVTRIVVKSYTGAVRSTYLDFQSFLGQNYTYFRHYKNLEDLPVVLKSLKKAELVIVVMQDLVGPHGPDEEEKRALGLLVDLFKNYKMLPVILTPDHKSEFPASLRSLRDQLMGIPFVSIAPKLVLPRSRQSEWPDNPYVDARYRKSLRSLSQPCYKVWDRYRTPTGVEITTRPLDQPIRIGHGPDGTRTNFIDTSKYCPVHPLPVQLVRAPEDVSFSFEVLAFLNYELSS